MKVARRQLLLAAPFGGLARAQAIVAVRLGLAPYLSPAALLATFRPMSEHLQRTLEQPVETYTARDFHALAQAVRDGHYDIALLPAHMARIALADWRWHPLARSLDATPVVVLARGDGPVRSAADLRGRSVAMLDLMSLTSAVGARWLADQGLPEVRTVVAPSINSALIALERDEVAAVVAAASQLLSLPAGTPQGQRTLARVENIPGPCYVGRAAADAAVVARWRDALLAFTPDPGRPRTAANAKPVALAMADLDSVEPHAAFLRRQLLSR